MPPDCGKYIVPKGYVALDGISLTVCDVNDKDEYFTIMMIPHTQDHVALSKKKCGELVNLEVDMVGKYVDRCFKMYLDKNKEVEPMKLSRTRSLLQKLWPTNSSQKR